nr:unnamed protein product [Callosobruchus chinensis]
MSQTSSLLSTNQISDVILVGWHWIKGVVIPFITPPRQTSIKDTIIPKMNYAITFSVSEALEELIELGVASECQYEPGEFLSSYFLAKKPNGKSRFILNLKELNKFIHGPHFKLENYRSLLKLLSHNSYLGNIDMKDAYYMIAVNDNYKKYLRFL